MSRLLVLVALLVGATAVAFVSTLTFGAAVWNLLPEESRPILVLSGCYALSALVLFWRDCSARNTGLVAFVVVLALAYLPFFVYIAFAKIAFSRNAMVAGLAAGGMIALLFTLLRRLPRLRTATLTLVALGGLGAQIAFATGALPRPEPPQVAMKRLRSSLYALTSTQYTNWIKKPTVEGGGITRLKDSYLLATGDGDLYRFSEKVRDRELSVEQLPYTVPINSAEFARDASARVDVAYFRVADALTQEVDGKIRLLASHHFWHADRQCFVVRVSMLEGPLESFLQKSDAMAWQTIFESTPCVPIVFPDQPPHFGGIQVGGRLALLDRDHLLVSVGDNELDGWNVSVSSPQDPTSSYGKTVLVDLTEHSSSIYSIGHRNPQGLFADTSSGSVWLTEHGPQGGDELNLVVRENYGWPLVTYGVQYGTHAWPFDKTPGNHDGYKQPFYSWVPSIGVSNLLVSDGEQFPLWKGDIVVSSLQAQRLFRLRVRDDRVVMVEQIDVGERLRDIEQGLDGELVLWADGSIMFVRTSTQDASSGEALFDQCSGCHAIDKGRTHGIGPDLHAVVDRAAGQAEDFQYSPAMRAFGQKWTRERLEAFLADPKALVPGTSMQFTGMPEASSRAKLVEFLASGKTRDPGEKVVNQD